MIHDMSARARATDRTRTDIVGAVTSLLREEHPAALTVPAVAEAAGVSVRTVYRHFPTKADLLDAASRRYIERLGDGPPASSAGLLGHLHELWELFDEDREAVRVEHRSAEGRALRTRRLAEFRPQVRASVDAEAPGLDVEDRDRLADLVIAVASSGMFLELVDRLDHRPGDAADLATWAVRALLRTARTDGGIRP